MKQRSLVRSDLSLSELSFGAAGIGNLLHSVSTAQAETAVQTAWDIGVRYFDSAPHYGAGLSERRLGCAFHSLHDEHRVISTKVGRILTPLQKGQPPQEQGFVEEGPFARVYNYSYDAVMRSFEDSIQRLGVSEIDILLMHDIGRVTHGDDHGVIFKTAMESGYQAMDELRSQGLVKAIGLGVNEWEICSDTFNHADFDCFMTANCFTLLNTDITDTFTEQCSQRNIDLIVAAPFNSGILATGSTDPSAYWYGKAPQAILKKVVAIEQVCKQFNVTLGAAAIQYPLRFEVVKSVTIGMTIASRIVRNYGWYLENIPEAFWQELQQQGLVEKIGC